MKFSTGIIAVSVVILIVLASFVVILRNRLDMKELELSAANKTVAEQVSTIARLTNQRKIDDRIVTEFTKGLAELRAATEAQSTKLSELAKNDPETKNFLDLLIPPNLGLLLNGGQERTPEGSGTNAP